MTKGIISLATYIRTRCVAFVLIKYSNRAIQNMSMYIKPATVCSCTMIIYNYKPMAMSNT